MAISRKNIGRTWKNHDTLRDDKLMWCNIHFPCHSSPFGTICGWFPFTEGSFSHCTEDSNPSKWERSGHFWFSGHGHIFAICFPLPTCCHCYAIFGNSMWNSVRLVDKHNSARETWCANDLVTFSSRPKDIALYQLELYFFWILLVCFSWSFRIYWL